MDTSGILKFDPIKVNTDLALKYLQDNNNEFYPILNNYQCNSKVYVKDSCDNKIYTSTLADNEMKSCALSFTEVHTSLNIHMTKTLRSLAKLVEKNDDLFAQLDFMIRKIPVEDTKAHIKLIVQNILCCGNEENWKLDDPEDTYYYKLPMTEDSPLLCLGSVAQIVKEKACLLILATKDTAVVCHLFTKLCHDVGLNQINFVLMVIPKHVSGIPKIDMQFMIGCTGVVTEKADLDSAVDVFLTSTITSPWRLRRILVQECVYDAFKKAVEWKCGLKTNKLNPQSVALQKLCTDLLVYDGKELLFDYAGPDDAAALKPQLIFIEAYRTSKELISLIKAYNVHYLSLWSNHISEANEVAFTSEVPIVWINDYATFHGPPKASQAIYSRICISEQCTVNIRDYDIVAAHKKWLHLPLNERRDIMLATLENHMSKNAESEDSGCLLSLQNALVNWESDQVVEVTKDKMCVCIDSPVGIVMLVRLLDNIPFLKSVVSGNAVIFNNSHEFNSSLIEEFQKAGVPVVKYNSSDTGSYAKVVCDRMYTTRAVWTNFESIFAN